VSDDLRQGGIRFLKRLARYAEPIMDAYLGGSVPDDLLEPGVRERLLKDGVLYRPEPGADLHLRRAVRALLEESLRDDRNRQIDANTASALASFRMLAEHFKEARYQGRHADADVYLADLREHLYAFGETLRHVTRVLWGRINNEFGYVSTLNAKIRENELAQSQVSSLLEGLELVRFEEQAELAGEYRELRHLLVTNLQLTLSDCTSELSIVQARLLELLGRFREIRGRSRLLKGWRLHMEHHPDYRPARHTRGSDLPGLLNRADPVLAPASADIYNANHEPELLEILSRVRTAHAVERPSQPLAEAEVCVLTPPDVIEIRPSPIREAVAAYFCEVIDSGQAVSALAYHDREARPWDAESWVYQVIGGYEELSEENKCSFVLELVGEPHPSYSGNFIVRDLSLWLG
jgi:hypothetical protein